MGLPPRAIQQTGIEQVKDRFETWRRSRVKRCAIPEQLWQAAESLYPQSSLYRISKALRLNYADLKRRIEQKPSTVFTEADFIELDLSDSIYPGECFVEMQAPTGAKMRMHFKGNAGLDFLELSKEFFRKTS